MKNIFSNLLTIAVFFRLCEFGAKPITALIVALAAGVAAEQVIKSTFNKKRSPHGTSATMRTNKNTIHNIVARKGEFVK